MLAITLHPTYRAYLGGTLVLESEINSEEDRRRLFDLGKTAAIYKLSFTILELYPFQAPEVIYDRFTTLNPISKRE